MQIKGAALADQRIPIDGTVFIIRPITSSVDAHCADDSMNRRGHIGLYGYRRNLVRFGVVGWENLTDVDGVNIDYNADEFFITGKSYPGIVDAILDKFTSEQIAQISDAVAKASSLPEERKNASSAAGPSGNSGSAARAARGNPVGNAGDSSTSVPAQ